MVHGTKEVCVASNSDRQDHLYITLQYQNRALAIWSMILLLSAERNNKAGSWNSPLEQDTCSWGPHCHARLAHQLQSNTTRKVRTSFILNWYFACNRQALFLIKKIMTRSYVLSQNCQFYFIKNCRPIVSERSKNKKRNLIRFSGAWRAPPSTPAGPSPRTCWASPAQSIKGTTNYFLLYAPPEPVTAAVSIA